MQINLYATFRLIAGEKKIIVDLPNGSTIMEVIRAAVKSYPVLKKHWFDDHNDLHAHVHVFYNGVEAVTLPQGFDTPLNENDALDLFPPVSGGSLERVDVPA
ncbi:MAG: MoaD/ThiS family protein [Anaerolineae bacterium]|nr:MoaD/ThiS family protein [Anaerolineae bacterium]